MPLRQLRSGTRTAAAAAATLMLVAVTACGDDGDSSSGAEGRETVTVAALPLIDCVALYIARDRGLFEKEGLDVRIQQVQQSLQALPALAKGQIDMVASANYVTYLQAYEKGTLDIRIVAEAIRAAPRMMEVLVSEDSDIKTVADLEGKKLAVNVLNNVQSLTFDEILAKQGVGRPVYRAIPFPQMGAALDKGQVDAVHAVEPYDSALQDELKARVLIDGSSAPVEAIPLSGYVSTSRYVDGNVKTLAAFQRAIKAAVRIAEEDPSVVRDTLPTYTKVTEKQAESIDLPVFPPTMDAVQLKRLTDLMEKHGMLKKPLDPATLLVK
ncbi:NitT/TauT family transport system substrate-binding protein [Streptomyces sp. cf386]|uniref:ABC transporter substrate-binding protein n=1 Tax=Streptomyces sp. cf386 TaxID=1761904 RepID=UPI00088CAFE1|nr:ABC transporter substrate-binding protein [Streptomyces sp. cf386]SDP38609.1 NitT/TauT family transport system substrate-binding protein [Streptomyces sp. cf386]